MTGPRLGEQRPTRMRRIGERHMVVLPAQSAEVLDVDLVRKRIVAARAHATQVEQQLAQLRAGIADLEGQLARFEALPIERVDDDPDVPQPARGLTREEAEAEDREGMRKLRGELTLEEAAAKGREGMRKLVANFDDPPALVERQNDG